MMRHFSRNNFFLALFIVAAGIYFLMGTPSVPFHPDESTNIWMSGDLLTIFTNPSSLIWKPEEHQDPRMHYRMVDAPLTRDIIGLGIILNGNPPPQPADWDWSLNWNQNNREGALPSFQQLTTSRFMIALLFPFSLILLFLIAKMVGDKKTAWITVLLYASNALVLLHTRRAMSEGVLMFTGALCLWSILRNKTNPFLIGLTAALSFNAKFSLAPLAILGVISIMWPAQAIHTPWKKMGALLIYSLTFAIVTYFLNPYLWSHPIGASLTALHERQILVQRQVSTFAPLNSGQVPETTPERLIATIAQSFFIPPSIAETSNYLSDTRSSEVVYFSNPMNNLLRGWVPGALMLVLCLFGFALSIVKATRSRANGLHRTLILLLGGFSLQYLSLIILVPLSFQRYVLPLVPYLCIWCAIALTTFIDQIFLFVNRQDQNRKIIS